MILLARAIRLCKRSHHGIRVLLQCQGDRHIFPGKLRCAGIHPHVVRRYTGGMSIAHHPRPAARTHRFLLLLLLFSATKLSLAAPPVEPAELPQTKPEESRPALPASVDLRVLQQTRAGVIVAGIVETDDALRDVLLALKADARLQTVPSIVVCPAEHVAASMDYVGVLCVEFFLLQDGSLVANEMAPRPHNSGHHSIDSCDLSQFDLQVRAMTGAPLVMPRLHSPCVMLNLLGDLWFAADGSDVAPDWAGVLALPGVHLHLYGKASARPGRKMGHLTVTAASAEAANRTALAVAALLGIEAW